MLPAVLYTQALKQATSQTCDVQQYTLHLL